MKVKHTGIPKVQACEKCGTITSHIGLSSPDGVILVPRKEHKAPCGLPCSYNLRPTVATKDCHGFEGKCKLCDKPVVAPEPEVLTKAQSTEASRSSNVGEPSAHRHRYL